jgi:thioredoxin-dependent peroxiredoxin
MQGYQAGIQKFRAAGSQVLGISTDNIETLKSWATSLNLDFPLLSDDTGKVAQEYGVLMPGKHMAFRTTFVVDRAGKIASVEQGSTAIDTTGAQDACSRLEHSKSK